MTSPDIAVLARDLHKQYGDKHAVDGLDLDVRAGEIFAILGPNGAGKTTTIEILEGFRHRGPRRGPRAGRGPAARGSAVAEPDRHRPAVRRRPGRAHRRASSSTTSPATTRSRGRRRGDRRPSGSPRRRATRTRQLCPAASAVGSTSPWASSGGPSCSSSTSRRPASTPRRGAAFWDLDRGPPGRGARRSCSPRTTSTRPNVPRRPGAVVRDGQASSPWTPRPPSATVPPGAPSCAGPRTARRAELQPRVRRPRSCGPRASRLPRR